jgi:hypothetical protein
MSTRFCLHSGLVSKYILHLKDAGFAARILPQKPQKHCFEAFKPLQNTQLAAGQCISGPKQLRSGQLCFCAFCGSKNLHSKILVSIYSN